MHWIFRSSCRQAATILLTGLLTVLAPCQGFATELIVFLKKGCSYCLAWERDIGGSYALTQEGRMAPLRRVDLQDRCLDCLTELTPVVFTPTFVLVDGKGREVGRITGYPGPDFFWPLLQDLLQKNQREGEASCAESEC